eukprot:Filipodium_phascolosomae@DN7225_c0_g1_i1.p1
MEGEEARCRTNRGNALMPLFKEWAARISRHKENIQQQLQDNEVQLLEERTSEDKELLDRLVDLRQRSNDTVVDKRYNDEVAQLSCQVKASLNNNWILEKDVGVLLKEKAGWTAKVQELEESVRLLRSKVSEAEKVNNSLRTKVEAQSTALPYEETLLPAETLGKVEQHTVCENLPSEEMRNLQAELALLRSTRADMSSIVKKCEYSFFSEHEILFRDCIHAVLQNFAKSAVDEHMEKVDGIVRNPMLIALLHQTMFPQ